MRARRTSSRHCSCDTCRKKRHRTTRRTGRPVKRFLRRSPFSGVSWAPVLTASFPLFVDPSGPDQHARGIFLSREDLLAKMLTVRQDACKIRKIFCRTLCRRRNRHFLNCAVARSTHCCLSSRRPTSMRCVPS
ncbi:hypothetical protein BCAR13_360007 [Paraburkholderia caribensis]|nr:hypothetical protein BCAR13_360007 [Paraburkholderia caribensis]